MGPWLAGGSPVTHTGSSIAIAAWMVLENKFIIIPGSKGHVINRRPLGLNLVDELRLSHQNVIIEEHQKCRVYIADEIPPPREKLFKELKGFLPGVCLVVCWLSGSDTQGTAAYHITNFAALQNNTAGRQQPLANPQSKSRGWKLSVRGLFRLSGPLSCGPARPCLAFNRSQL